MKRCNLILTQLAQNENLRKDDKLGGYLKIIEV